MVSIVSTLRTLVWAMILLLMIIYVFGILFAQAVRDHLSENEDGADEETVAALLEYWGGLATAMFTLFKTISNGLSWHDAVEPLHGIHWTLAGLFTIFITFTYFAVLNVLTAVFCQSAIDSAQLD